MRRLALGLMAAGVLTACSGGSQTPRDAAGPVKIESISPGSGTIGTEIVITGSGFDSLYNQVGFKLPDSSSQYDTAFTTGIPSPDGKTLRFALEDDLGSCSISQVGPTGICAGVGLTLPIGKVDVSVHNEDGTSRPVKFTRLPSALEAAQQAIWDAPEYEQLRQLAHDIFLDSFNPTLGQYANTTRVDLRESQTGEEAYIELEIKGSHVSALESEVPDEINGVEVRVIRRE